MKIASIIILLFISIGAVANAQDATVTMSMTDYEMMKTRADSLSSVIAKNKATIDSLNKSLIGKDLLINQINGQLSNISKLHNDSEARIVALKDSLSRQLNEMTGLRNEIADIDMVRLRYANGRLHLPFNQEKINDAIEMFNSISDVSLKNECSEVLSWLRQYHLYLNDVQELMRSLQSDKRRTNKFEFDEWRSSALKNISQNKYVRDSSGHQFSIIYLDDILSLAKHRITKATKPTVDFSDLIERLQL